MQNPSFPSAAALLSLTVAGCIPAPPEPTPALPGTVEASFTEDASAAANPLPDARLGAAGLAGRPAFWHRLLPTSALTYETEALLPDMARWVDEAGGWGPYAPVYLPMEGALREESGPLPAEPFFLVRLDAEEAPVELTARWVHDPGVVVLAPVEPLAPGARYAYGALRQHPAVPLEASADYFLWSHGEGSGDVVATADALAFRPVDLAVVATFETHRPTDRMTAAAARLGPAPVPVFDDDEGPRGPLPRGIHAQGALPLPVRDYLGALPGAGRVAVGRVTLRSFLDDGALSAAKATGMEPADAELIELLVIEPDPVRYPPPWPAVIVQHGFSASKEVFVAEAEHELLDRGFALLAIDAVRHGPRGSALSLFAIENLPVLEGAFQQTALELLQVAHIARAGTLDIDGVEGADLSGEVLYLGNSMGSIIGGIVTALMDPPPSASVLNVPGGGISRILQTGLLASATELLLRPALGLTVEDPAYDDALPLIAGFAQVALEGADPIEYAPLLRAAGTARPVLLQEAVGDLLIDNGQTAALAAAAGIDVFSTSQVASEPLQAWWRCDPYAFGAPLDENPHGMFHLVPGVRRQAAAFLHSRGQVLLDVAAPASAYP